MDRFIDDYSSEDHDPMVDLGTIEAAQTLETGEWGHRNWRGNYRGYPRYFRHSDLIAHRIRQNKGVLKRTRLNEEALRRLVLKEVDKISDTLRYVDRTLITETALELCFVASGSELAVKHMFNTPRVIEQRDETRRLYTTRMVQKPLWGWIGRLLGLRSFIREDIPNT